MASTAHHLVVANREPITPNMLRFTLTGNSLADFPEGFEGGYVKLVFPRPEGGRPLFRSYTVRSFDPVTLALVIDIVSHGAAGPAGRWASESSVGDRVIVAGPGPCRRLHTDAEWFLIAGDMSALPAIEVNLRLLPDDAAGHAVLEIIDPADRREIQRPKGIELTWVVNNEPATPNHMLQDAVMALALPNRKMSAWVAGEYASSRALRQYLRYDRPVDRNSLYVSSYWKIGETDEGMKAAKGTDSDPW